jgi:TorA maturation chaperone TorD
MECVFRAASFQALFIDSDSTQLPQKPAVYLDVNQHLIGQRLLGYLTPSLERL